MNDPEPRARHADEGRTRFVLIETSHRGNVGAAARALKVMGFADLVLVAPRFADVLTHPETLAMASGATDVLAKARVVSALTEGLDGITHVCATAMTPRDFGPPTVSPREHLPNLAGSDHRVAFVFGSERFGMSNDDVYRSHVCLSIPTSSDYGSLNLAQAVQVVAYEWRLALGGFSVVDRSIKPRWADVQAIEATIEHWREALVHLKFLDPAAPKKLVPRLQQLALRQGLTNEEVHILRGIARSVIRRD